MCEASGRLLFWPEVHCSFAMACQPLLSCRGHNRNMCDARQHGIVEEQCEGVQRQPNILNPMAMELLFSAPHEMPSLQTNVSLKQESIVQLHSEDAIQIQTPARACTRECTKQWPTNLIKEQRALYNATTNALSKSVQLLFELFHHKGIQSLLTRYIYPPSQPIPSLPSLAF